MNNTIKIPTSEGIQEQIIDLPRSCPHCHFHIVPNPMFGSFNNVNGLLEVFMQCPAEYCQKTFIAHYHLSGHFEGRVSFGTINQKEFTSTINSISPSFTIIYNQAFFAEQHSLSEVCGVGYRKALEFLIKDYLILIKPDEKENIEKKLLGACIDQYIVDGKIKAVAKRAVWLGNDETHYIRKWEFKNLEDLKRLIDLTIHWIEMELLTQSFEDEMPV